MDAVRSLAVIIILLFALPVLARSRVDVRIDTSQADAVLELLGKLESKQSILDSDWQRVFSTEGYVRLKKRELAMGRSFEDGDFKAFVMSPELLGRRTRLAATLERWKDVDADAISRGPLSYLPSTARIRAKIYPVIKPRTNSFVFDVKTDPAIFMYLDPDKRKEVFENELSHELHHIGFGSIPVPSPPARMTPSQEKVIGWIGAFGEGFAMLAAAGGPDIHPHRFSPTADRDRWDRDVANFNDDLRKVERFLLDLADGKLDESKERETAMSFYGVQGPWYTVGWKMAVVIEKTFGRNELIKVMTNQRDLLPTYNRAVKKYNKKTGENLALWSGSLLQKLM
jgi:hypothetical protein